GQVPDPGRGRRLGADRDRRVPARVGVGLMRRRRVVLVAAAVAVVAVAAGTVVACRPHGRALTGAIGPGGASGSARPLGRAPAGARVEGGDDHHVIAWDQGACKAYELYSATRAGGGFHAYSGAVFDLRSNRMRPLGFTSADAAGLSILAGLVRYDEVAAGHVD